MWKKLTVVCTLFAGVEKGFAIGVGQSGASVPVAAAKDHGCGGCTGKR